MFGIGLLLSMITSALLTIIFWKKTEAAKAETADKKAAPAPIENKEPLVVNCPLKGEVKNITKASDPAFASEGMGKGICIEPKDNVIYAPCDAEVAFTFPSKHAIGLRSAQGVEIMLHCGIDTVNMNGEGFESLVSDGEHVSAKTPLIRFDREKIKANGYKDETMMIITNSADFDVAIHEEAAAGLDTPVITVRMK